MATAPQTHPEPAATGLAPAPVVMLTTMTSSTRVAVRLLATPYDSGRRDERMGAGPLALLDAGAARRLESAGHPVSTQVLEAGPEWTAELRTAFELQRTVAQHVADARRHGEVPLLLAGTCNTTLGVLAGLGDAARVGLVWLDAHGDRAGPMGRRAHPRQTLMSTIPCWWGQRMVTRHREG